MRLSVRCLGIAIAFGLMLASVPSAWAQTLEEALVVARRQLHIAKLEYRLYRQVEFPRLRRQFDADVQVTRAEIRVLKERVRRFRRYDNNFTYNKPFFSTLQNSEIRLLEAELHLKDLLQERAALTRFRADKFRLYALKVEDARARVIALERQRQGG